MPTLRTDGSVERRGFRKCPTIIINILLFKHHDIDVQQYFVKILPEKTVEYYCKYSLIKQLKYACWA